MMRYLLLGECPVREKKLDKHIDNYDTLLKKRIGIYISQIKRICRLYDKNIVEHMSLVTLFDRHTNRYYAAARYDDDFQKAVTLAFWIEENLPQYFDDNAKEEVANISLNAA